jgi:hypothetical protein
MNEESIVRVEQQPPLAPKKILPANGNKYFKVLQEK